MNKDITAQSSRSEIIAGSKESVRSRNNFQEFGGTDKHQLISESSKSSLSGLSDSQSIEEQSSPGPSQSSAENHAQAVALNESTRSLRWADSRSQQDFQPILLPDGMWKQQLAAIRKLDKQKSGGFIQRILLWVKRRIMVEKLNVPDPLEQETKSLIDEFTERLDHRLHSLDSQHLHQLLEKRKQIFKRFGKFRYINESELEVPYGVYSEQGILN